MHLLLLAAGRRSKFVVLALCVLAAAALAAQSPKLDAVVKDDVASQLPRGAESLAALRASERFPSAKVQPAVVVFRRAGGLTASDLRKVRGAARRVRSSPPDLSLPAGRVDRTRDAALLVVPFRATGNDARLAAAVKRLRALVASNEGRGALQVAVTGGPPTRPTSRASSRAPTGCCWAPPPESFSCC